jgi:cytochrome c oxidase assembly protein subunit 15
MNASPRRIPDVLRITTILVFVLVVWGGVVRLSGSGLAIPDWPLAGGQLVPKPESRVLIEYIHRVIAGLVALLTVGVSVAIYRSAEYRDPLGGLAAAALVALALQIFVGARVVLDELPVDRVVTHLLLAFFFFGILVLMTLIAGEVARAEAPFDVPPEHSRLRLWARIAAAAVFLQAGLGAWVSSSGAALACPDFPTCQGRWLPPLVGLVGIHYTHRLGAYAVFLLVGVHSHLAGRAGLPPRARRAVRATAVLLVLQMLLGIGNVLWRVPLPVSASHLGVALLLFGSLVVAGHEIGRR